MTNSHCKISDDLAARNDCLQELRPYRQSPTSIFSSDETAEAAKIVASANEDLTKIKVLYKDNENKREDLKKAMEADNAEQVKKIADEVV